MRTKNDFRDMMNVEAKMKFVFNENLLKFYLTFDTLRTQLHNDKV